MPGSILPLPTPMPDFLQTGSILTLPLLQDDAKRLRADLTAWSLKRPLALLLPCHARDLESPALTRIIATVAALPWISYVIVGLDGADEKQHQEATAKFKAITQDLVLVHHDTSTVAPGKGRNIRDLASLAAKRPDIFAVAIHDCDIRTYSRDFLARLCWPVLHPDAGIQACKGYYVRTAAALHGRVFRLLFQPLLRAWCEIFPGQQFPAFLRAFRYPLSGELCITRELLARQEFDHGWGFEVRMLHSLYRTAPRAICQTELCNAYDHKHQSTDALVVMAKEIIHTFLDTLSREAALPTSAQNDAVLRAFQNYAAGALRESALMTRMHDLKHDRAEELELAAGFAAAVRNSLTAASKSRGCVTSRLQL